MLQKKILVVDDDVAFIDSIEMFFSSEGFSVVKLINPDNIFDVLEREIPDLILLDVYLPKTNGFEILKNLKSHYMFSSIPVIMITADVTVHIDKAFSQGADDCIFKPVDPQALIKRISKVLHEKII
ncbi:MAG: response regulator [Endomicrobium sp.]|jgi:PleD family two-component response regulator|nr:response regulator [Endomicrobium sp.]